jgi:hypothetical protein
MAAKTIYAMFYVGAVEGADRWIRPNQVARMTDRQLEETSDAAREAWQAASLTRQRGDIEGRWFADNTREPIRDETIKDGLRAVGAVLERPNTPTTSSRPRWALAADFADLFLASERSLHGTLEAWRQAHLSARALSRIRLMQRGLGVDAHDQVEIRFPNGEMRRMAPGPSSQITKSVIEEFAPRFLGDPAVLWVSESARRVVVRDRELAEAVGFDIEAGKLLPDIILADLEQPLFVFVEVVATDGPVTEQRRRELLKLVKAGGHRVEDAVFVTAFLDRDRAYPRVSKRIAWDSFVWYASEPGNIVSRMALEGSGLLLSDLMQP